MSVVPDKIVPKIQFFESRVGGWASAATDIGTTTTQVASLQTRTDAARAAYDAQQAAQIAARDATTALHVAVEQMAIEGRSIIKQIRSKADIEGNGIYALASLPAPAIPAPVGDPGTPEAFKAALLPDGSLELSWKCTNPPGSQGVLYHVFRKNDAGAWDFLGATGIKKFPDLTVPSGVATLFYRIRAARSAAVGIANEFSVNLGVTPGGTMTASVASPTTPTTPTAPTADAPKLAA